MDYRKSAGEVIKFIGGKENIITAAHCATRLRLVIVDNSKINLPEIEKIEGVKGVFEASGQLQIIFGTGIVNKIYNEFLNITGLTEISSNEIKKTSIARQNIFKRAIKIVGDIFVPIIPAIVASGLLMGLLEGMCNIWPQLTESDVYVILHLFSNAAFVFLPILIAISSAKTFGGNLFLGAVIGMILIHPDLVNAWDAANFSEIPKASVWFGLYDVKLIGYQGHVIPVIIAVWIMSVIEKGLHRIVPEIIDLFVTPLVTVLVTGYLTLTIVGPLFSTIENFVLSGAEVLITLPFGIGSALAGGLYAPTVVAGLHHMYNALEAGLISKNGINTWMPIATAANVAQGAAALAVAVKSRQKNIKAMAFPAALSAYLGITEPAIFGVNIRFFKAFVAGCIGGFFGALIAGWCQIGATAYGITGIFGFLITTNYILQYAFVIITASVVAFILSYIMYKNDQTEIVTTSDKNSVCVPVTGQIVPLNDVPDETFSEEILGKGFAVIPEEGRIYAPFDGKINMIYETKHAIGITSKDGIELLIHVGIETVELAGKYFKLYVNNDEKIKSGQLLLEFDMKQIMEAGYKIITPVIITNTDDYDKITVKIWGKAVAGTTAMVVEKQ